jgi:GxxExxY protein
MRDVELFNEIIGIALEIYRTFGPGMLDEVYKECMFYKMREAGLEVERDKEIPVDYENMVLKCGFTVDFIVDNKVVVLVRSNDQKTDLYIKQAQTYVRLGDYSLGLLINFDVTDLRMGLKKVDKSKTISNINHFRAGF